MFIFLCFSTKSHQTIQGNSSAIYPSGSIPSFIPWNWCSASYSAHHHARLRYSDHLIVEGHSRLSLTQRLPQIPPDNLDTPARRGRSSTFFVMPNALTQETALDLVDSLLAEKDASPDSVRAVPFLGI
jgi:hypothetical protein